MKRRAVQFAILYTGVILYLSLYPGTFLPEPQAAGLTIQPFAGKREALDAVLNFLFYVPLGVALGLSGPRRWMQLALAVLAGGGLSWCIETLQLWIPFRSSSYSDLAMNTAGTLAGAAMAHVYRARVWTDSAPIRWLERWRLPPTSALFFGLWILWQAFPFIPRISLPATVAQLTNPAPWSWSSFAVAALGMATLRAIVGRSPWNAVGVAAVLCNLVLLDRTLVFASVAGAAIGWAVAARLAMTARVLAVVLPLWLCFEELRPFRFSGPPMEFSLLPFATWFDGTGASYYPVIFQKLFFYTATPWLLYRAKWPAWRAVGVPLGILILGELAQRYLPGRTPEVTDPLLLLAGWTLVVLTRERVRHA